MALVAAPAFAAAPSPELLAKKANVAYPAVIAHRGASYDAPEATKPAYLAARDLGADYLEMDLQRTRDGQLVGFHDDTLLRTTDVAARFPDRRDKPISEFTLAELKQLDAGSWFNAAHPDRARAGFVNAKVLTLDEIIDIAEADPQHKAGLYIETKVPNLYPGIEADLKAKLIERGWLTPSGEVAAGRRVVLQTFEKASLELLAKEMPKVPKVLLLWVGKGSIEPESTVPFAESGAKDKATWYASQRPASKEAFTQWVDFAKAQGAVGTGPSAALTNGGDQSYMDLVQPWMNKLTHTKGLLVHVYTVDEPVDFEKVKKAGVDGIFTNRAAELLKFYGRPASRSVQDILAAEGY
nr:glycerophosphodiester phosphodiesterase [Pseudomonas sp. RIT-PI-S]